MIVASIAEVMSIGAVLPFLGALTRPDVLLGHSLTQPLFQALELTRPEELLLPLTAFFIATALFAGAFRVLLLWFQTRLAHSIGADFSIEIYKRTLCQPYQTHLSRNSSEVIAGISTKVNLVVYNSILPALVIVSSSLILLIVLGALVLIDPIVSLLTLCGFGSIYCVITLATKKQLETNSENISRSSNQVIKALQEGLGGIRDVLIDGTQNTYCAIYSAADASLRRAQANNSVIAGAPRFLIEALGMSLIALFAYSVVGGEESFTRVVPTLGAFTLGAQRLLPVVQQIYHSWSSMRGGRVALTDVLDLLTQPLPDHHEPEPVGFEKSIRLNAVDFRYADQGPLVLANISIEIKKGSNVGFIGSTGSGKSTLLDVVMGLLPPTEGALEVDGVAITNKNYRSWQAHLAHVPQSIFLADISIAENIAFGVPLELVDMQRVKSAAERAQIASTIESWDKGYQTLVGERGVRLSGGQRQRIGIARALYKQADVIVFDEATSALDSETETAVIQAINAIGSGITVLMVAHRLSTLAGCDTVYKLSQGRIKKSGALRLALES